MLDKLLDNKGLHVTQLTLPHAKLYGDAACNVHMTRMLIVATTFLCQWGRDWRSFLCDDVCTISTRAKEVRTFVVNHNINAAHHGCYGTMLSLSNPRLVLW